MSLTVQVSTVATVFQKQPEKMKWFNPVKVSRTFHNIVSVDLFVSMMRNAKNIKHKSKAAYLCVFLIAIILSLNYDKIY